MRSWNLLDGTTARLGGAIDKRAASSVLAVSEMHQKLCENQQQDHKRV
jgi:predicted thioredoxin/glutaredoxin